MYPMIDPQVKRVEVELAEFEHKLRGYYNAKGQELTLNLQKQRDAQVQLLMHRKDQARAQLIKFKEYTRFVISPMPTICDPFPRAAADATPSYH